MCLKNEGTEYIETKFKLEQGIEAKDFEPTQHTEGLKKDSMQPVEEKLNKTLELTQAVHRNMNDLRKSGGDQQLMSESTTITVVVLGCVSVGIVILSVAVQVWYLKSFFKQRKIL